MAYHLRTDDTVCEIIAHVNEAHESPAPMDMNHIPNFLSPEFIDSYVNADAPPDTISPLLLIQENSNIASIDDIEHLVLMILSKGVRVVDNAPLLHQMLWGEPDRWGSNVRRRIVPLLFNAGVDGRMMMPGLVEDPELPLYLHLLYYVYAPMHDMKEVDATFVYALWKVYGEHDSTDQAHFYATLGRKRLDSDHYRTAVAKAVRMARKSSNIVSVEKWMRVLKTRGVAYDADAYAASKVTRRKHWSTYVAGKATNVVDMGGINRLRMQALARFHPLKTVEKFLAMASSNRHSEALIASDLLALPNVYKSHLSSEPSTTFVRALLRNDWIGKNHDDSVHHWNSVTKRLSRIIHVLENTGVCKYADGGGHVSPLLEFSLMHFRSIVEDSGRGSNRLFKELLAKDKWLAVPMRGEDIYYHLPGREERHTFTFGSFILAVMFHTKPRTAEVVLRNLMPILADIHRATREAAVSDMCVHITADSSDIVVRRHNAHLTIEAASA